MKTIRFQTVHKKMLADIYTPVGIYLRLRDKFRDTILLESTDFHAGENSYSIIGINAIAGIEVQDSHYIEFKLPGLPAEREPISNPRLVSGRLGEFLQRFESSGSVEPPVNIAQGLFGYSSFDAIQFFETLPMMTGDGLAIPLMRYRLYQYVIIINHYKDELYLCENVFKGMESKLCDIETLIKSKDVPLFPFNIDGEERSTISDEDYRQMVRNGVASCHRGDSFQLVLSRRFTQGFKGDDFNVYRALRSINPSPYLFYFDYGDYKLTGSSPEAQVIIKNGIATVHPIAGTYRRTGDDETDKAAAIALENDPKENAEHVMLVDLARNDLSKVCTDVAVTAFRKVQYYSHVIHLVSEVSGKLNPGSNPFDILGATFPAGTLSGAPKYKALELIAANEKTPRGFYGGAIGWVGFDGSCNQAIMIRTFLSRNNTLVYQAGAGIVAASVPENELQEVNNKLGALKNAIRLAETITK